MGTLKPTIIRDVADTAYWVASYRAIESRRPDALFCDPYAEQLAGELGPTIAQHMRIGRERGWAVVMRTFIIDRIIMQAARENFELVLNLGAGFDTRPYRLDLPPTLSWIDVDQEKVITSKQKQLENVAPRVPLEFITADLSDAAVRQSVLDKAAERAKKVLVLSEGVMCYLPESSARLFASQLHATPVVHTWVADLMSQAMLHYAQSAWTSKLVKAPFIFSVEDAGAYFQDLGWQEERWYSVADEGCAADRAPWRVQLSHAMHKILPRSRQKARRRLSGVAHLTRRPPQVT